MPVIAGNIAGLSLDRNWSESDPKVAHRGAWPVYAKTGARSSAATYFEIEAGMRIGMHTHDAEETILVVGGLAQAIVDGESAEVSTGDLIFVPEGSPHDILNEGDGPFRALSFFPKATVSSTFEVPLEPDGSRELGTPG